MQTGILSLSDLIRMTQEGQNTAGASRGIHVSPDTSAEESASSLSLDGWCGEEEKERGREGGNEAAASRSAC